MAGKLPKEIREMDINWTDVDDMVSITAYEKKYINQLKSIQEKHPDEVEIVKVNDDGTWCVHLPKKYVHVSIGERAKREMTKEQKAAAAERMRIAREKKAEMNG